ncbi:MAG: S-layer homology domain-containing protein [Clostridia bacterium]|nr:S-layer homology domain-containing protein [Clostridia bacterium]
MKKFFAFCFIFIFSLTITVLADNKISPAIDVIACENSMIKAGIFTNGEICFDVDDFDLPLGTNVQYIKIVSLPDKSQGRLMLDNLYILENQVIYRDDFSLLRFVSITEECKDVFFSFSPNGNNYTIECALKSLKNVNLTPTASNGESIFAWTLKNTSLFGSLNGYDPEGDELKYEIVSYPSKGILFLENDNSGDYKFTPYIDACDYDSFTYRVRDSYGNYSNECTVTLKIEGNNSVLVFKDLDDERYINAVTTMYDFDLMNVIKNEDGTISFNPNEDITMEEFVVLVMKAMGAKNVPKLEKTRFADDELISKEYKGYIESAFSLGIIEGTIENDGVHFNPKSKVTTADAAVIINKIIGIKKETYLTVFKDNDEIPEHAKNAISALTEIGIFSKTDGKISPNKPLTRAQTAKILMSLLEFRGKIGK